MLDPAVVVIVAGPDYWRPAERTLNLGLRAAPFPLIRAGEAAGRNWLVGYHPTYSRQVGRRHAIDGGTNAYYVRTIQRVLHELEAG